MDPQRTGFTESRSPQEGAREETTTAPSVGSTPGNGTIPVSLERLDILARDLAAVLASAQGLLADVTAEVAHEAAQIAAVRAAAATERADSTGDEEYPIPCRSCCGGQKP